MRSRDVPLPSGLPGFMNPVLPSWTAHWVPLYTSWILIFTFLPLLLLPLLIAMLPPASEVLEGPYDLKPLRAPALGGLALRAYISVYESGAIGPTIYNAVAPISGVTRVLHDMSFPENPLFLPHTPVREATPGEGCAELPDESAQAALRALTADGFMPELAKAFQPAVGPIKAEDITINTTALDMPSQGTAAAANNLNLVEQSQFRRPTIQDYVEAYSSGKTTPTQVAERIVDFIARSNKQSCEWFIASSADDILRQAKESTQRWAEGKPRSVMDGVPYAVKDVLNAGPYPTTVGTVFAAEKWPAGADAPYVTALRDMGAILLGKTTMHAIGLGVTGLNLNTGTARNPYNPAHFCGGSSSGSAAVLAAGLCPIAVGSDGGGSIRVPSAFCGLVGLKPTAGRVSGEGSFQIDCTVAVLGPMAASVQDAAILYAISANFDAWYTPNCERMPTPTIPKPLLPQIPTPLSGGKAGIYWEWFRDADPDVVAACTAAVAQLEVSGAEVQAVNIPELELLKVAHNLTIVSEMLHCFQSVWDDPKQRRLLDLDVRVGLATAKFWTPADYLQAQRIRQRATTHFRRVFKDVDVIITPTAPCTAPAIPKGALKGGRSDLGQTSMVMRYVVAANFLGLPAISVPVGVDSKGMPIGLQIMGKPWSEGTLLRWASVLEKSLQVKAARASQNGGQPPLPPSGIPQIWIDPLTGASAGC